MESKSLFASRTFWVNVLTAGSAFLAMGELQDSLGPNALRYVILVQAAINVIMRLVSTGTVTVMGGK